MQAIFSVQQDGIGGEIAHVPSVRFASLSECTAVARRQKARCNSVQRSESVRGSHLVYMSPGNSGLAGARTNWLRCGCRSLVDYFLRELCCDTRGVRRIVRRYSAQAALPFLDCLIDATSGKQLCCFGRSPGHEQPSFICRQKPGRTVLDQLGGNGPQAPAFITRFRLLDKTRCHLRHRG
jgi:hypothetical protein